MSVEEIFKKSNQQKAKFRRKFYVKGRNAESAQQVAAGEEEADVNEDESPHNASEAAISTPNMGLSVPEPMSVNPGQNTIHKEAQAKTSETRSKTCGKAKT